jgi:hypothetical protein
MSTRMHELSRRLLETHRLQPLFTLLTKHL